MPIPTTRPSASASSEPARAHGGSPRCAGQRAVAGVPTPHRCGGAGRLTVAACLASMPLTEASSLDNEETPMRYEQLRAFVVGTNPRTPESHGSATSSDASNRVEGVAVISR